ncbi:MAG TPA: helix-turn-helix domain-containing protein, partial [Dermatophilaceae bacterium]|nr:helix-turn-helix domain-containing protein [Dermatophilaceae bacterium]
MSERATYHHGDLRQALISAAVDLISAKGVAGLSVAEAARKAGVSGAAPYRHFASRTALLSAAATALATDLLEHLQVTAAGGPARG